MKKLVLLLLLVLGLTFTGVNTKQAMAAEVAGADFPQWVVVLDYSAMDTMDALGLAEYVAALPKSTLPGHLAGYKASDIKDLGNLREFDLEAVKSLKPDLIIMSGRQNAFKAELEAIAPTISWNIDTNNYFASFKENILNFSAMWNKKTEAEALLAEIDAQLAAVQKLASAKNVKALVVLHNAGKFSPQDIGSRYGIIFDEIGVARAYDIPKPAEGTRPGITTAEILQINPDILFIMDRDTVTSGKPSDKASIEDENIRKTKACQNGTIAYLPSERWYLANSGINSMKLMLDDVRKALEQTGN